MESTSKIVFRQARDFSGILNATFAFIRQNFRKLGKAILFIVGPFIVLSGILYGLYNAEVATMAAESRPFNFLLYMLLLLITSTFGSALFFGVVNEYIVLYMDKGPGEFDVDEIWQATKKDLGLIILTALGFALVVGLGLIFCFFPGVYLFVPLSMLMIMRIRERKNFGESLSRCFKLISGSWWPAFGLLLVAFLIHSVLSVIFYIPNYIVTFWNLFHRGEISAAASDMRLLMILTSTFAFVGSYLFYSIPILAISFQYFNLVERREAWGLFEKIEQLGASPNDGKAGSQLG